MKVIDLRGEPCPVPLIKTIKELEKLKEGDKLHIIVDMPCARENVPKYMAEDGHDVEIIEKKSEVEIIIRKRNGNGRYKLLL